MEGIWLNDKQPDENGDITAVVKNSNGQISTVYKGKTIEEVADKMLIGQAQANREISRLFKKLQPDKGRKQLKAQNKVLTADDKFRLAAEMSDPDKVVGAVQEIVNTTTKVPLEEIAERAIEDDQTQSDEYVRAEAEAFVAEYPDYYPITENKDALIKEVTEVKKWDWTRNNLALAYNELMEQGKLVPWPAETARTESGEPGSNGAVPVTPISIAASNGQPEPPPPSPRPRSTSTGLRNSDASALPPPPNRKKQYTRADIELMSRSEFTRKLQEEPGFRQQVDAMGS